MYFKKLSFIIVACLSVAILLPACGEYYQVQKSADLNVRYSYAKKCYNEKKYGRVIALMEDIVSSFAGTEEGAQALFILADAYYQDKRYADAAASFEQYYKRYPKGDQSETARYLCGKSYVELSPDPKLDQKATMDAIRELQTYLDYYPNGQHNKEVQDLLFELQDKLAYKEYLAAKLYYNLGLYMGNNYKSAVVTARATLKDYPYTKHREELEFLILEAKYQEALNSVVDKTQSRYREVLDQYYAYVNAYPEGKYLKQAMKIYDDINKKVVKEN